MEALDAIPAIAGAFSQAFGRSSGGLVQPYRSGDAETVVVALQVGARDDREVVDELREEGMKIGALGISCFRPYPLDSAQRTAERERVKSSSRRRSPSGSAASSGRTCASH